MPSTSEKQDRELGEVVESSKYVRDSRSSKSTSVSRRRASRSRSRDRSRRDDRTRDHRSVSKSASRRRSRSPPHHSRSSSRHDSRRRERSRSADKRGDKESSYRRSNDRVRSKRGPDHRNDSPGRAEKRAKENLQIKELLQLGNSEKLRTDDVSTSAEAPSGQSVTSETAKELPDDDFGLATFESREEKEQRELEERRKRRAQIMAKYASDQKEAPTANSQSNSPLKTAREEETEEKVAASGRVDTPLQIVHSEQILTTDVKIQSAYSVSTVVEDALSSTVISAAAQTASISAVSLQNTISSPASNVSSKTSSPAKQEGNGALLNLQALQAMIRKDLAQTKAAVQGLTLSGNQTENGDDRDDLARPMEVKESNVATTTNEKLVQVDLFGNKALAPVTSSGTDMTGIGLARNDPKLQENWDDADGYYNARIGEMLLDRYKVLGVIGKGVFSSVVKCIDSSDKKGTMVAVKLIRNNETMRKAAVKELSMLKELSDRDPDNKKHIVQLLSHFEHRNHVCLVFEPLNMNLRETLKKFGKDVGVNLNAVRVYAKQMFIALHHLQACNMVHADIKPDNILVNEGYNILKICDFGSGFRITDPDNDPTPYLVSRFYRAPEIILGLQYDFSIDMWSVGCCLYEMFTGKVMFPGASNNEMLRLMMEVKGKPPNKIIKRHRAAYEKLLLEPHFDEDLKFKQHEFDRVTGKLIVKVIEPKVTKDLGSLLLSKKSSNEDRQIVLQLKDLLERCFHLDPSKRLSLREALHHSFLKR